MEKDREATVMQTQKSPEVDSNLNRRWRREVEGKRVGKWTRSNSFIGKLPINEANRHASELSDGKIDDLTLPTWANSCRDWRKCEWMSGNDVVYRRILCLLCHQNVFEPVFVRHMQTEHPNEDAMVATVLKRMSEVRVSRFGTQSVLDREYLENKLPNIDMNELVPFLEDAGVLLRKTALNYESSFTSVPPCIIEKKIEHDVKGIPLQDAIDFATVLCEEGGALPEVLFGNSIAPSENAVRPYLRSYCYFCRRNIMNARFRTHFKHKTHSKLFPDSVNYCDVMLRMSEVRLRRFFDVNPIPLWKLKSIAQDAALEFLTKFLLDLGYSINMYDHLSPNDTLSKLKKESKFSSDNDIACSSKPTTSTNDVSCKIEMDDVASSSHSGYDSDGFSSAGPSSVTSNSSSSSHVSGNSRCQRITATFLPYFVLNRIRLYHRVEHAILDLESFLDLNETTSLDQHEYIFLMGLTMLGLVIINGCKLTALSKLCLKDIQQAKPLSGTDTSSGALSQQWIVADKEAWRILQLFLLARTRRARCNNCEEEFSNPLSNVFVSFGLKVVKGTDVSYPISQFLRMSGVECTFRATTISAAVEALAARDFRKDTPEYAFDFYERLRAAGEKQAEILGTSEASLIVDAIEVNIRSKTRKDKGVIRGTRGPQSKTLASWEKKAAVDPKKSCRSFKKRTRNIISECDEFVENGGKKRRVVATPERNSNSPTRNFARTPSPEPVASNTFSEHAINNEYHYFYPMEVERKLEDL